jgi:5-methylcytosine-specific restriction enzyme A
VMALRRTTRLASHTPLARNTPLKEVSDKKAAEQTAAGKPVAAMKTARPKPAVPGDVRAALAKRSGGLCEMQLHGCAGRAVDPSHRIARGMGGSKRAAKKSSDALSNLLHACRVCHEWCHARPAEAYEMGLFLKHGQIPAQEPVLYRGEVVYLTDDGQVLDFEAVGA